MTAARGSTADPAPGDPAGASGARLRRWTIAVAIAALAVLTATRPGRIFFDTKLGVDIDPAGFLARLWPLWNPLEWFGAMQDQYIGYAFPIAPFYLLAHGLGVPAWAAERAWLALLVAVGFAGVARLARALRIGSPRTQVVAGLAFALWPASTIVIGSTSAGLLPGLLAPWAVLPLVAAARGGSLPRAAARSGIAVLCMGGVNAASTLAALLLPALFILTRLRGRRRAALAAWWAAAVALATSWWLVPLLLQGRYGFDFLPYVEQSATTTATMSAAAFLRGAGNWTAYLDLGQPWLPAGWIVVTNPAAIVAAAMAAATGLLGLARRDMPAAGWLRLTLGVAALAALAGYPGPLGGPFHAGVGRLLDGPLAPLRSVYKVEPAAAAVLALGIAHALRLRGWRARLVADPERRHLLRLLLAPVIALVLAGLAYPYLAGQVLNPGAFTRVPGYWYRVAAFLRAHSPRAPALVVPAQAHGAYLWGQTVDDVLEPLAGSPWVADGLVPFGGAGSALLLSSLSSALASGEQVPGLAAALARAGIGYVVVRNDLSPASIGYVPPEPIHATLASSGFRRVAAFGPLVTGRQTDPSAAAIAAALPSYPAVEVYQAAAQIGRPPPSAAVTLPVSRTTLVNGGPDALLQLAGQGLLDGAPAVIAGDPLVTRPARWLVTDGLRRADHAFGLIGAPASDTYTAAGVNPPDDPLGDPGGPPRQLLPVSAAGHQTVAVLTGAASVTASSTGSWLAPAPQISPVNAFDGNPATYWTEASPVRAAGQWIQIRFDRPVRLPPEVTIRLLDDGPARAVPSRLTARTAPGTVTTRLRRTSAPQLLRVAPGPTRFLRITIAAATGGVPGGPGAGISDVTIPGVTVTSYLEPAQSRAGRSAGQVAFSFDQQVPSPASLADVASYPPLARTFTTYRPGRFRLAALAIAVPGRALDALLAGLAPAGRKAVVVAASSTWASLPRLSPANLLRARHPGPWVAGGPNPVIRLSWRGRRTIGRLILEPLPGFAAAPASVKVTSPAGVRYADVGLGGLTQLVPPLTTDRIAISFPVVRYATTPQPAFGQAVQLPVGLSRLVIPALAGLRPATAAPGARFSLPCGSGPQVTIDGRTLRTKVWGTVGDVAAFLPVHVGFCSPGSAITLPARRHWLVAARPGAFSITGLSLTSAPAGRAAGAARAAPARTVRVLGWQPDSRRVLVGPGPRSYLELHQNANAGWVATLGGQVLRPVRLDGWQQGYVLPSGRGGVVTLTFRPAGLYHAALIASGLGVLALAGAALGGRRREPARPAPTPANPAPAITGAGEPAPASPAASPSRAAAGEPAPAAGFPAAGFPAAGTPAAGCPALTRSPASWLLAVAALAALLTAVGGPVALAVPALLAVACAAPGWYPGLAFAGMLAAGVLSAASSQPAAPGNGAFGAPAQACALVALAVALTPARPAVRPRRAAGLPRPGRPARRRFSVADELTCYYDRPGEPASIHLEARVAGRLDLGALRAAVQAVLAAEPGLSVRRAGTGRWRTGWHWESAAPDVDEGALVRFATPAGEAELGAQRARFLSERIPLERVPPLRFLLASGPDGDCLIVNAHHALLDGYSCLRLLRAVADEYSRLAMGARAGAAAAGAAGPAGAAAAEPAGAAAGEPAGAAAVPAAGGGAPGGCLPGRVPAPPAGRGRLPAGWRFARPARVAAEPGSDGPGGRTGPGDGYGLCQVAWDGLDRAAGRLRMLGASVNDLLIAAMAITITGWNESHGARPGPVRVTMPVGDRAQAGPRGAWANASRLTTVTVPGAAGSDLARVIAIVAAQTARSKAAVGPQVGGSLTAVARAPLPVAVKGVLLRAALRVAGPALCDTTLVSNLGAVEPPCFGALPPPGLWFSTTAHMPRGISLGAVTTGSRLRLSFRYRQALLADPAAAEFAGRYLAVLTAFAGPGGADPGQAGRGRAVPGAVA